MSKFDEAVEKAMASADKAGIKYDADLLRTVAKGLGPSIYNTDSRLVACSDKAELERINKNFVSKKLGVTDAAKGMEAIKAACSEYGSRSKNRAVFYYHLANKLGKLSVYK